MTIAPGRFDIVRMPSRFLTSLRFSRLCPESSFLENVATSPEVSRFSSSSRRWSRPRIVSKFVRVPPSQRSVTNGHVARIASPRMTVLAPRLVPT